MLNVDHFNVRIVRTGDKYGREMCLTHEKDEPLVEFYDARYNQFVSRYYASTLLESGGYPGGLCLDGGHPDEWSVSAEGMARVIDHLREELA